MAAKEAPVIEQIRAHREFLKQSDLAKEAGLDYPRTRKTKAILAAEKPPGYQMGLRQKARERLFKD